MSDATPPPETPVPLPARVRALLERLAGLEARFLAAPLPAGPPGRALRAAQAAVLSARRYREDHAGDRAAALAFASLLSLVPLLLLGFAAFGRMGLDPRRLDEARAWLFRNLVPETARGCQEVLERSLVTLEEASAGLGVAGMGLLVLAGWKLLATLQRTFGQLAGSQGIRARLSRMVSFWTAVILSPLLAAASLVLSGGLQALGAEGAFGGAVQEISSYLLPFLAAWASVLVLYRFGGGPKTRWKAAALGATAAALLWEGLKLGFAIYVKHTLVAETLFAGLGVVPVFLLWLYLSWAVVLLGAELAFVANDYDVALQRSGIERK